MDFPSRSQSENGGSRLSAAQKHFNRILDSILKLKEEEKEPLRHEEVKNPNILLNANSAGLIVQPAGDLQNEVQIEEESDFERFYVPPLNAADLLYESAPEKENFGYYKFLEEERKPFDEDNLFEDVKNPDILLEAGFNDIFAPNLQNEVKIEDESEDGQFGPGERLNAADLLESAEDEPSDDHMGRLLYTCSSFKCPSSYDTFKELEKHMEIHSDTQIFRCDVCRTHFFSKEEAMTHIRQREKMECCGCGKKSRSHVHLVEHLRWHTVEMPFVCTACGQRFDVLSELNKHSVSHTGRKLFSFGLFSKKASLETRERVDSKEKSFKCDNCDFRSSSKQNLVVHNRRHTGEKPYSCGFCEKRFAQSRSLKSHEMVHTGEKLLTRERMDSKEKSFKCDHCDFRSNSKQSLAVHNRRHTGEKPYSCGFCEKRFAHSGSLRSHEMIHTGEKPFECNHCERRFNQKTHLKKHLRLHSGEKSFSCKECDKKFTSNEYLKKHMKNKHSS